MEKKTLIETLKKYNTLLEYNFYLPSEDGLDEQDVTPEDTDKPADPTNDTETSDMGTDIPPGGEMGDAPMDTAPMDTAPMDTAPMDTAPMDTAPMDTAPMDTAPMDTAPMDTAVGGEMGNTDLTPMDNSGGDVEVDITDLVTSAEDSNQKLDGLNQALNNILQKFDELEGRISSVDQVMSKIDNVEKEVEKRLPTPVEKLELRSLDSYPYNMKLSDFWDKKNEELGVETTDPNKETEFVLTQDNVMDDYDPVALKSSFDVKNIEDLNM